VLPRASTSPAVAEQPDQKLEGALGTELFVRTSREVKLTAAGQALVEEATARDRGARAGRRTHPPRRGGHHRHRAPRVRPTRRLRNSRAILAAVENDNPNITVIASELFSAELSARVLAGELDLGLALHPEPMRGIRTEALRVEPLAAVLSKRHRLA